MDFVVTGIVALLLYAVIQRLGDRGSKKAEQLGMRANRRD